ncbi:MAG: hypothetical protein JWO97_4589 [Acidobacteria bacterium]|nr:hypothetical protein [Acidobacteriota bacterium]
MRRQNAGAAHRISERDAHALRFVGEGYEVAQYALHEAAFSGLTANVVSRFVTRWHRRGVLAAERLNGIGMNRLRLSAAGRDLLIERGLAHPDELFAPRKPVAPKDLQHTLFINDARVALGRLPAKPSLTLAAWALQRRFAPRPTVVPDVLAIWRRSASADGLLLASEIDLGGESLRAVFIPKLELLRREVDRWRGASPAVIVVLTHGARRVATLRNAFAESNDDVSWCIEELPPSPGRRNIEDLQTLFAGLTGAAHTPTRDSLLSL